MLAKTLSEIEDKINSDNFVRVSRKHLVNRKFITEIGRDYVLLSDKTVLPVAQRRLPLIRYYIFYGSLQ